MQGLKTALQEVREAEREGRSASEAIEKLIRRYNGAGVTLTMTNNELEKATLKIKLTTIRSATDMSLMVLRDEFDFGAKRLIRFLERWKPKTQGLLEGDVSWKDMERCIEEETGLKIEMPWEEEQ